MASSTVVTLTKGNLTSEVHQLSALVLVYFWAEWCKPCRMIAPILGELADQYDERVKIYKINIDEHPELAAEYGIRAVPTLVLLRQGQVAEQIVGLRCQRDLEGSVNQAMA